MSARMTENRRKIMDAFAEMAGEEMSAQDVADLTELSVENVRPALASMAEAGLLVRVSHGRYRPSIENEPEELGGGDATGSGPTNDAESTYEGKAPYIASMRLQGSCPILFHRWSNEAVAAKAEAAKGSAAKKTDNLESMVYRCPDNSIGIPGVYLRQSIVNAGKYRQDPRSPRKSAMDLLKAAIVPLTVCASLGRSQWDYVDQQRVTVQRNGVTRSRPAFREGWEADFDLLCNLPEYVTPTMLLELTNDAGRFVGLGDFRPTYGRFTVVSWRLREQ